MQIDDVITVIERHAPKHLAASWDNTGLLLRGTRSVQRVGLCIDLTETVLEELLGAGVDLIIAYHPPIFKGVKRFDARNSLNRMLLRAIRECITIYSPHTALDAAADGMGDWLAASLGDVVDVVPVEPTADDPAVGMGRRGSFSLPVSIRRLLPALKSTLGLPAVRIAGDLDRRRATFAVCPGSGGGLFSGMRGVDLFLTGEMGHHDVLARVAEGSAVILTDHTNTERGFLPVWGRRLAQDLEMDIVISRVDTDPLKVV